MIKLLIISLFALCSISASLASESNTQKATAAGAAAGREPINSVRPVSGDTDGSVGKPVYGDYRGKSIAFCCKDCARKFRKHPGRYGSLAEKNQSAHEPM